MKIENIVREYAEAMCPVGDYCGGVYDYCRQDDLSKCRNEAEPLLEWLSKDYYIVPKEQIRTMQKDLKEAVKEIREDAFPVCEFEEKLIFAEDAVSYIESLLDSDLFDQKEE